MSTKNKTAYTDASVVDFVNAFVDNEQKKEDSFRLMDLMQEWSGCEPRMFGGTIIGFGSYHYKYASGHEGQAPLIGFSPPKAAFSLYATAPGKTEQKLLEELGKFTMGKGCIYFKKLADLDMDILEKLSKATINYLRENHDHSGRL